MSFTYSQSTGDFSHDGALVTVGYSGIGPSLNNPNAQHIPGMGPIPQGTYTIQPPIADENTGPVSMHLVPAPENEMFGRADFLIHGDSALMNHTASHGCIILNHDARVKIGEAVLAGNDQLEVTA